MDYRRDKPGRDVGPVSKRTRVVRLIVAWVFGVPFMIVMWAWLGWFSLILLAGMLWLSWDYYRRGEVVEDLGQTSGPVF
jgi:hypothetical protein